MSNKKLYQGLFALVGLGVISIAVLRLNYAVISIPSESMLPTLEINDSVLIDKYLFENASPKRGDLIIFHPPEILKKQNYTAPFIMRVVGLPGEMIEIKNGKVYLDGKAIEENYILAPPEYTTPLAKIPPRSYYVLGDNRNNSHDSRFWGYVTEDLIIGRAISIYAPPSRARKFN